MPSTIHMASGEDDGRHQPGSGSLRLWSESWWFPFYDAKSEIGVVLRAGLQPNVGRGNLFVVLTRGREIVHSFVDHVLPVPPVEPRSLVLGPLTLDWLEPVGAFRLRYAAGGASFDVEWRGFSPTYLYPAPPDTTFDEVPRHIEHAGRVSGTVTLRGHIERIDCLGHRDHSFGGERDWEKFHRWNYLSGEIDRSFWFNAVRIKFGPEMDWLHIGCLWDGREVMALETIEMDVRTTDGGTRQTGVDLSITDERGRRHVILGEAVLAIAPVRFGRTWLRDGFTRYRYGDSTGHGILEHGYVEDG